MKRILNILFCIMIISLYSCKKEEIVTDFLGLSLKNIIVNNKSQAVTVTTTSDQWQIYSVGINDKAYDISDESVITKINDRSFKGKWFTVNIDEGYRSIIITLDENKNSERNLMLAFKKIGYYDQLHIIQKGKE